MLQQESTVAVIRVTTSVTVCCELLLPVPVVLARERRNYLAA